MGRSIHAIQTRDLPTLFAFFGLPMEHEAVEARPKEITSGR